MQWSVRITATGMEQSNKQVITSALTRLKALIGYFGFIPENINPNPERIEFLGITEQ